MKIKFIAKSNRKKIRRLFTSNDDVFNGRMKSEIKDKYSKQSSKKDLMDSQIFDYCYFHDDAGLLRLVMPEFW